MPTPTEHCYQIGEASKASGSSIATIRYYEGLGLLDKPARSEGGFRLYSDAEIQKLCFIRKAQKLGFKLKEIKVIMRESRKGLKGCCNHVGKFVEAKLSELNIKIRQLQAMRSDLQGVLRQWIPSGEAKKREYVVCPQIESRWCAQEDGRAMAKKKVRRSLRRSWIKSKEAT